MSWTKRIFSQLVCVCALAQAACAAPNSYFHLSAEAFRLVGGDPAQCFLTTTSDPMFQNASPPGGYEWVMGDPAGMGTNCIIRAVFFMPFSSTSGDLVPKIFAADGTNTPNRYCYKTHFEFARTSQNAVSSVAGYPYLTGGQCAGDPLTTGEVTVVGRSSAFADQEFSVDVPHSCLVQGPAAASACVGTNCRGLEGAYFVERCQCGVDPACGAGTDAGNTSLFEGSSVGYTTP